MSTFLDSNVVLYALGDDETKRRRARELLDSGPTISTQVVNECSHVLRRKAGWAPARVAAELTVILALVRLVEVGMAEVRSAWSLAERYKSVRGRPARRAAAPEDSRPSSKSFTDAASRISAAASSAESRRDSSDSSGMFRISWLMAVTGMDGPGGNPDRGSWWRAPLHGGGRAST